MTAFLVKLDRFFAWVLLAGMLIYFISGYGMTKGLIDPLFATSLHTGWLPIIIILAFAGHTTYAIHLAFKRWRFWNGFSKFLLAAFYACFLIFFLYFEMFYKPAAETSSPNTNSAASSVVGSGESSAINSTASIGTTEQTSEKSFNLSELAKYNGKNGQSAYVAVDGVVYDMTNVFANGAHYGHIAGTELTNAFYTRHAKSAISKYPIVGKLE